MGALFASAGGRSRYASIEDAPRKCQRATGKTGSVYQGENKYDKNWQIRFSLSDKLCEYFASVTSDS